MSQDEIRAIACGTELLDLSLFDGNTASKCRLVERTIHDDVVIEDPVEPTIVRGAYRAYFAAEKASRLSATGLPGAKIAPGERKDASRVLIHGYVKDQQTLDTPKLHTFLNQSTYFAPTVLSLMQHSKLFQLLLRASPFMDRYTIAAIFVLLHRSGLSSAGLSPLTSHALDIAVAIAFMLTLKMDEEALDRCIEKALWYISTKNTQPYDSYYSYPMSSSVGRALFVCILKVTCVHMTSNLRAFVLSS